MHKTIEFTPKEVEIILHRLTALEDSETLEELFEAIEDLDVERVDQYVAALIRQFESNQYSVELSIPEAGEILKEALEGSTFFRPMKDMVRFKQISSSTVSAYRKAARQAAGKIEEATGLSVEPTTESDR